MPGLLVSPANPAISDVQGAKEDAEAVTKGADAALHKAVAAAEHLPGALEQLPGNAGAALPVLQARAEAAAEAAKVQVRPGLPGACGRGLQGCGLGVWVSVVRGSACLGPLSHGWV